MSELGMSTKKVNFGKDELQAVTPVQPKYAPEDLNNKIKEGESNLAYFMDAMKLLLEKLHQVTGDYHGQITAVANLRRPPSPTVILNEMEDEGKTMMTMS